MTDLLTVKETAERLRISQQKAYDLIKRLPFVVRVGKSYRIPEDRLEQWIESGGDQWQDSTKEATSGGPSSTRTVNNRNASPQDSATEKPPSESQDSSSWKTRYHLKSPRYS